MTVLPKLVTASIVVVAIVSSYFLYQKFESRPWTRDGQIRANVVQITPRVNGYLINVAVKDNQSVTKGDLLFQIDPSQYQLAVTQAEVSLRQARQTVRELEASIESAKAQIREKQAAVASAQSKADAYGFAVKSAESAVNQAAAGIDSATAKVSQVKAQLAEAEREAERAIRLADKKAGSVQTAQAKTASKEAYVAEVEYSQAGLKQAKATLAQAQSSLQKAKADFAGANNGLIEAEAAVVTSQANLDKAKATLGDPGEANYRIQAAIVNLETARLNLGWTSIYAPSDGYISNMRLSNDTFVSAGTPFALFVDANSLHVEAYFQETQLKRIKSGSPALVTLMGYDHEKLEAEVESIGYAIKPPNIAETDGPGNIVPTVQPTFEWIRLAQRVPVRIRFKRIPDDLHLVSGMTASVAVQE